MIKISDLNHHDLNRPSLIGNSQKLVEISSLYLFIISSDILEDLVLIWTMYWARIPYQSTGQYRIKTHLKQHY